jgi:hypothetical protein
MNTGSGQEPLSLACVVSVGGNRIIDTIMLKT